MHNMHHRRGKSRASQGNGSGSNMASLYNAFGMTSDGGAVANDEEFELFSVSLSKCHTHTPSVHQCQDNTCKDGHLPFDFSTSGIATSNCKQSVVHTSVAAFSAEHMLLCSFHRACLSSKQM
jgi:hypothetical protein